MKKVAATKGHSVSRMDFFFVLLMGGATVDGDCARLVVAVAVANFDGFLLKRLTLTTASPLKNFSRLPGELRFPGHVGEVSSQV
jgi:hypothetical protein